MDAESLNIILSQNKENILLRRAITDAYLMLRKRKSYPVVIYDIQDADFLLSEIKELLSGLEKEKQ
jgi:hypothetical protein